jgi:hypothetical protein
MTIFSFSSTRNGETGFILMNCMLANEEMGMAHKEEEKNGNCRVSG